VACAFLAVSPAEAGEPPGGGDVAGEAGVDFGVEAGKLVVVEGGGEEEVAPVVAAGGEVDGD